MQAILDSIAALRTLVETNVENTGRLQAQINELSQPQPINGSLPTEPETIVDDLIPETEVERLRRENAELVRRVLAGPTHSVGDDRPSNRVLKVGDPPLFHGKKEELPGFLAGLNVIFALQHSLWASDRDKIMHAYTFMRGPPQNALTPAIIDERVWAITNWTRSYTAFTDYLRMTYGDPNERQTALDK